MLLLNWYQEQLLEKLGELDPTKSRQLRGIKARKTTIIKALEDLGFDPGSHHGSCQMEDPDNDREQQQVAFAITALQQQQQQQLQQHGSQELSLQEQIETTVCRMLPEVVQAVISIQERSATTVSTRTVSAQGPASADSLNFHGAPPQGGMAQASLALPLQSNRNPRTNVSLGMLNTQHLGSVNSSHSTSLATANWNMVASNPPTGTTAGFLDTRSSGIHTGNMNSNISNGINQHNRGASVMNA